MRCRSDLSCIGQVFYILPSRKGRTLPKAARHTFAVLLTKHVARTAELLAVSRESWLSRILELEFVFVPVN